ncbi:MAG: CHASE2 domain-containing protein [Lachnospiraceae bacterium]|nr:CHASE2 domain-containing protein [Lachnospiraceae bacterium]
MTIIKNKKIQKLLITLLAAAAVTLLIAAGILKRIDSWMQDAIYQQPAYEDRIVVIGIDESAFERLGAYQTWDRSIMASALEKIAEADPDERPAVVAIDTLYTGETDPAADERLAKAAEELGNVVTAGSALIGTVAEEDENGNFRFNYYKVLQYDESYDALKKVTKVGHINAMYDTDAVLRHALLYVDTEGDYGDNGRVYSMAYETAKEYLKSIGESIVLPKTDAHGNFYVSYVGGPGAFYDHVSIADLIEGTVSSDYFDDKILFIGPYAVGLQDQYFTPIDRARQMYGVEFQANVVRTLIDADYKKEVSKGLQVLLLFLISFGAFWVFESVSLKKSGCIGAGLIIVSIAGDYIAYKAGLIAHRILSLPPLRSPMQS